MTKQKEILFGGVPEKHTQEEWEKVRFKWTPERKKEYEEFEAWRKSPANNGLVPDSGEKGATLEQVYKYIKLIGAEKYCLISTNQPEVPTGKIQKVIKLSSSQLVQSLKQINETDGSVLSTLLHYDGYTGHCIILDYFDKEQNRFFYRDPWPWESLLSAKNNIAGVNARKEKLNYWSVTDQELETVIFAIFVYPGQWDRTQKIVDVLLLNEFKKTDFFNFFHLTEIARYDHADETEIQYSPSRFEGIVVIALSVSTSNRIKGAKLLMTKDWMRQNFILVMDITRSYLKAFAPGEDNAAFNNIVSFIKFNEINKVISSPNHKVSSQDLEKNPFIFAFAGLVPSISLKFKYSILDVNNVLRNNISASEISVILP